MELGRLNGHKRGTHTHLRGGKTYHGKTRSNRLEPLRGIFSLSLTCPIIKHHIFTWSGHLVFYLLRINALLCAQVMTSKYNHFFVSLVSASSSGSPVRHVDNFCIAATEKSLLKITLQSTQDHQRMISTHNLCCTLQFFSTRNVCKR